MTFADFKTILLPENNEKFYKTILCKQNLKTYCLQL